MRRYMQGTLDFTCGIYAVINALSCIRGIDLAQARAMFQQSQMAFAAHPRLWRAFLYNESDHYWVVRYMLHRWCCTGAYRLRMHSPYGSWLQGDGPAEALLDNVALYLPETHADSGPGSFEKSRAEAEDVWRVLHAWFDGNQKGRACLLRFHRFLPGVAQAVVSHWTCVRGVSPDEAFLHDASSEQNALHTLERRALLPADKVRALVRIVPESMILLSC